jgi:hypothetical protein
MCPWIAAAAEVPTRRCNDVSTITTYVESRAKPSCIIAKFAAWMLKQDMAATTARLLLRRQREFSVVLA